MRPDPIAFCSGDDRKNTPRRLASQTISERSANKVSARLICWQRARFPTQGEMPTAR